MKSIDIPPRERTSQTTVQLYIPDPVSVSRVPRGVRENLSRERVALDEIEAEARLAQLDSIESVRLAVLETNGKISFLPK